MKPFESWEQAIAHYLDLRRALGFKLRHETWWLPSFVSFLQEHGSDVITTDLAVAWAMLPGDASPTWWARRLRAVRRFACHHRAFDARTQVPPSDLLAAQVQRAIPYIYSDDDIVAVMAAAGRIRRALMSATYVTLIGLLATTGLRVGEAIALDQEDVDWRRARLHVRNGKFHKSRYVPLGPTTLAALATYAEQRERLRPPLTASASFFVSLVGTRLIYNNVTSHFAQLVREVGLTHVGDRRPRLHDLRHSFAVSTLRRWYIEDVDVEVRLPALSTYLGHISPTTTYWYLTGTPELLALASRRAERAWRATPCTR